MSVRDTIREHGDNDPAGRFNLEIELARLVTSLKTGRAEAYEDGVQYAGYTQAIEKVEQVERLIHWAREGNT